ncbi:MAG: HNH endonuclease [Nannocystaceae bacterium]
MASENTLVLSQGYQPLKVVSWQRAACMGYLGKVEMLRAHPGQFIHTVSEVFPRPAVVRLIHHHRNAPLSIRFSRHHVYLRDGHTCQYCHEEFAEQHLTLDHVVPRAHGGKTTWDNVVTACGRCNRKKKNRTPREARMPLRTTPRKPSWLPATARLGIRRVPEVWQDWLTGTSSSGG